MNAVIGFFTVLILIVLVIAFPYIGIPAILVLIFICIKLSKTKSSVQTEDTSITPSNQLASKTPVSAKFNTKNDYSNYSRFFQKWDDSYNKELGYEWFQVCVEFVKFPIYNSVGTRLFNIRKSKGLTQMDAARMANISTSTLSSYENSYTTPSKSCYELLSSAYYVPVSFIKCGYTNSLDEQIKLCRRFCENEYLHSLGLSVTAASRLFPEMLTPEDRSICVVVNNLLDMKLDLFNELAEAKAELHSKIRADIIHRLEDAPVIQRDLYLSFGDNRSIAQSVVKELYDSKIISKEKQGNTFILRISTLQLQQEVAICK